MKTVELSRGAWHWNLAALGGADEDTDICAYLRAIAKCVVGAAFLLAIGSFVAWIVSDFLAWIVAMCVYMTLIEPSGVAGGVALILILGIIGALAYGIGRVGTVVAHSVEDTFVASAYDSLKNRMCFRVKVR